MSSDGESVFLVGISKSTISVQDLPSNKAQELLKDVVEAIKSGFCAEANGSCCGALTAAQTNLAVFV
jgi:hypothetical protein